TGIAIARGPAGHRPAARRAVRSLCADREPRRPQAGPDRSGRPHHADRHGLERGQLRPIGITGDKWVRGYPDLLPHTGGGLYMRTRDLARVGYLVLRRGKWNTTQVVPESWLTESTRPIVTPTYRLGGRT